MKNIFSLVFFLVSLSFFGQKTISGKIVSENNKPLEGASVYFNNTTIGTISDAEGYFELKIRDGNFDLIISFLGFETITKSINTQKNDTSLLLKMTSKETILDEVDISKTKYDADWKYNLKRFKKEFLGRSKLASECKILNPKDLHFEFDYKTNTLSAFARKPLKIKHQGLGYLITYDLVDFTLDSKQKFFSGYARYQNLRKSVKRKWLKNRRKVFNGSQMHFLRSLVAKNLEKNGFRVNQFKRVLNPERPSEEEIKRARELIKLHKSQINFGQKITKPVTIIDSALVTIRKSRLPKYQDYLYKTNVPYKEMISFKNKNAFLDFVNYLSIIYKNEPEEENYLKGMFGKRKKASGLQTSSMVLLNGKTIIDISGIIAPGSFLNEGYWGFEAFADMLPLDYKPIKE